MILSLGLTAAPQISSQPANNFDYCSAEKRRGEEPFLSSFSAFLSESLRLCVNSSQPAINLDYCNAARQSRSRNRGIREIRGSGDPIHSVFRVFRGSFRLGNCSQAARKPNRRLADRKMRDRKINRNPIFLSVLPALLRLRRAVLFASRRCICAGPDSIATPQGAGKNASRASARKEWPPAVRGC